MTVITRALVVLFSLSAIVAPSVSAASISIEERQQHGHRARSGAHRLPVEARKHELAPRTVGRPATKKGVSWTEPSSGLSHIQGHGVSIVYNWGALPPTDWNKYGLEFVCQLRDGKASSIANFEKESPHHSYWMAMNEINLPAPSGSGLSAGAAAALYKKYMYPGCLKHYCIGPSVTTANGALNILENFFNDLGGIKNSRIRALSVHPYDSSVEKVIQYIESVYAKFGLDIWITETTCHAFYGSDQNCSVQQSEAFFRTLMAWVEKTPYVVMLVPFGWMEGPKAAQWGVGENIALLNSANEPTALAKVFLEG